ncbi:hypothetical protein EIP91_000460 [Steccherinum ochraceum]|uniref:Glucose-methanol-choline oxidoreductase N-terminal domain-containing protein n=1 Tax=Steccherinum ochraceum TaxID=92696 RepID=A0A4R0RFL8_9APHY|nr:hypothetical protein EIP91_000460 [Steccherinum ochraceum]
MDIANEYDVLFVGGGTAACVVASRLARAAPTVQILVVEAGPHTLNSISHVQPARYIHHILPGSKTAQFVVGNPSEAVGGRQIAVPIGHCVGGGSSINFAEYTRAAYSDYDIWRDKFGNEGWGFKDLLPYIKKCETFQVAPDRETHGYEGPLKVSHGGLHKMSNLGTDFLQMAEKYDKKRGTTDDPNSMLTCNMFGRWAKWIDEKTGHRSDVPHGYIYNKNLPNLTLLTGCLVRRILFQGTRAVGCEYVRDDVYHPGANTAEVHTVQARRMVILSAGTINSPLILERSGIGSKATLEKNGVKQIVDLPGVGENFQDHIASPPQFHASDDANTLDCVFRMDEAALRKWETMWETEGTGLLANNGLDGGVKYRPTLEELEEIGPEFQKAWKERYADYPIKPAFWLGVFALPADPMSPPGNYYCIINQFLDASGRGHIHITDKDDPKAAPDFRTGYLEDAGDLALMRHAYKRCREFGRRMACFRGEYLPRVPKFPEGSEAAKAAEITQPVSVEAADIRYTSEDDAAIDNFTRETLTTTWHPLGTCAMMPRDQGGVVDSKLSVYGTQALKVVDMSIAPSNVTTNTYSCVLAIAEKAAVMIGEELGVRGV